MSVMNIVQLFGGLGLFLFGMKIMSDGLEKVAGSQLKKVLGVVTHNRLLAMLAGVVVTALVQSSSATTVMVVGFVNAGILTLTQAVGVIMGANVGTTVTSLLLSIDIDFGAILCCLGLILTNIPGKSLRKAREIGPAIMGLGILFIGMDTMSSAMSPLRSWDVFNQAIIAISSSPLLPVLGVVLGALITALLQSSAASIGILQALAGEGLIPLRTCIFILFGQNIGTCITALLACSGANTVAKRTAIVHLMFNVIGTVLFVVLASCLPFADWMATLAPGNLRLQIAYTHITFNVVTTAILLPCASLLEKLACVLVREKASEQDDLRMLYYDKRLLKTPPIAVEQLFREVQRMGELAKQNFAEASSLFEQWDDDTAERVRHNEEVLDYLNREITSSLVDVEALPLTEKDNELVGSLFHVVNDMERVGDHSLNVLECGEQKVKEEVVFSEKAFAELQEMSDRVLVQLDQALQMLVDTPMPSAASLAKLEEGEQQIDDMTDALRDHHVNRLKNHKCSAKNGMLYLDLLTNFERVADHAENIGTSHLNNPDAD